MIYINKNVTNKLCLSLKESNLINAAYYIFEFIKDSLPTDDIIYFYTPNISNYTNRYDLFELIDNDITGSKIGGINIPLNLKSGQYQYNIYLSNTISINPNDFLNIIETGMMVVNGVDTQIDTIYQ